MDAYHLQTPCVMHLCVVSKEPVRVPYLELECGVRTWYDNIAHTS